MNPCDSSQPQSAASPFWVPVPVAFSALAQQSLGRIIGQLRVTKGDFPPHQIMVELQLHGSTLTSVYADDQGRFGFYNLEANPYHVVINDPAFHAVDELANVNPYRRVVQYGANSSRPAEDM